MRPYVVHAQPFVRGSAGIYAMHHLVHLLAKRGIPSYVTSPPNPAWDEAPYDIYAEHLAPIVVYSNDVYGNPLDIGRVVRWVLSRPGLLPGPTRFDTRDAIYTWSPDFWDAPVLMVPTIEPCFRNEGRERTQDTCYVGKGVFWRGAELLPLTANMEHIIGYPTWHPPTRQGVADILNRTRTLYTYDDQTQVAWEALLCGCQVVLLPEGRAITTADVDAMLPDRDYDAHLDRFIEETQARWA